MTFTFDTSHFTKYTIAQVNEVLPQTGSFVNMVNMMVLSDILISIGAFLLLKKEVNR